MNNNSRGSNLLSKAVLSIKERIAVSVLLVGILIAAGATSLFIWIASEVSEGEFKSFDEAVRGSVHSVATPFLTQLMIIVSFLGSPKVMVGLGFVTLIVLAYFKQRRASILFLITMAGEIALDVFLKALYARARPEPFFDYTLPASFSFPSGHALGSFCFFGILAWLVIERVNSRFISAFVALAASTWVLLIGISRIYLGVHYPTDVIAGYLAAAIWLFTVILAQSSLGKKSVSSEN